MKKSSVQAALLGFISSAAAVLKEGEEQQKEQGAKNDLFFPINPNNSDFLQFIKTDLEVIPIMRSKENSAQQK